jgi:hypothetical protein
MASKLPTLMSLALNGPGGFLAEQDVEEEEEDECMSIVMMTTRLT